ncbi:MAG: hypothetical protein JWN04_684 [Myxococcaceae bacterium]|nr:hypothetical protein [Myxococcaceae bacterium]
MPSCPGMPYALFVFLVTSLARANTAIAEPAPKNAQAMSELDRQARSIFDAGLQAYDNGEFDKALTAFERAYQTSPRPKLLYNIGRAAEGDAQYARALAAYTAYLQEVPVGENRVFTESRIAKMRSLLAGTVHSDISAKATASAAVQNKAENAPSAPAAGVVQTKPAATGRYAPLEGAAVRDSKSGLNWQTLVSKSEFAFEEAQAYCAEIGWRLPEYDELRTLVDTARAPSIDSAVFPNSAGVFWTSTPQSGRLYSSKTIDFSTGTKDSQHKDLRALVRCVSGTALHASADKAAVIDGLSGLTWQRLAATETMELREAHAYCARTAGWRLPTLDELEMIVRRSGLASSDGTLFPRTPAGPFWSSTESPGPFGFSFPAVIDFKTGGIGKVHADDKLYVRCVCSEPTCAR